MKAGGLGCAVACLLWVPGALAQDAERGASVALEEGLVRAETLRVEDVLASLERSYPQLLAADAEVRASEGALEAAEGGFDPSWRTRASGVFGGYEYGRMETAIEQPTPWWGTRFFGGYRIGRGDIPSYYGEYYTGEYGALRAGVEVPLWRGGPIDARRAALARAELAQVIANLSREQQRIELRRLAITRYWEWAGAVLRMRVAEALLETARVRDGQILERVERGDLPRVDHIENRRAILQREGQVVTMRRGVEQATILLSLFVRDQSGEPLLVASTLAPRAFSEPVAEGGGPAPGTLDEALRARPEARRLRAQTEQLRVDERLASNQAAPEINVLVAGSQHLGAATAYPKVERPQVEFGITVDIPLRNRVARGREAQAAALASSLEAQSDLAEDRIRAEVRDALSALAAATERVALARGEKAVAETLEDAERQQLALGATTMLIVNLREQATADAAIRLVDAHVDYERARAAYDAARGVGAARP